METLRCLAAEGDSLRRVIRIASAPGEAYRNRGPAAARESTTY